MKRLAGKTILILLAFLAGMGITAMGLKKPTRLRPACRVRSLSFGDEEAARRSTSSPTGSAPRAAPPSGDPEGRPESHAAGEGGFRGLPDPPETFNYIPYNLSFIVREKAEISRDPGSPGGPCAENEGAHAGGCAGGGFHPRREVCPGLNYADVVAGMQYFSTLTKNSRCRAPLPWSCSIRAPGRQRPCTAFGHHFGQHPESLAEVSEK